LVSKKKRECNTRRTKTKRELGPEKTEARCLQKLVPQTHNAPYRRTLATGREHLAGAIPDTTLGVLGKADWQAPRESYRVKASANKGINGGPHGVVHSVKELVGGKGHKYS